MCGIFGVWGGGGRNEVDLMMSVLGHRGPDDSGVREDSNVVLGMTRLAIIDASSGGHQPMVSPDGQIALVYNGELYNFREERALLEKRGYSFRSNSDTEVVLRMYEHYGDDSLLRMRGMFALAIYDKRKGLGRERLLLARDQFGIKPLLYATIRGRFVFASEIKALIASGVAAEVDPIGLRLLLNHGAVIQPRTILRAVKMLLPAHRLILEAGREEHIERYWSLGIDRRQGLRERPYEEQIEELRDALEESVRLQLVSDVPLGAFLSGGVDSSLLIAIMAQHVGARRVKTFSVGFEAEGVDIDETNDAERTAAFIGTDHTSVIVRGDEVRDRIHHIADALDQPTIDGVNSYFVSRAARNDVTVAISGTGGDELFAGYPSFGRMIREQEYRRTRAWRSFAKSIVTSVTRLPVLDPLLLKRRADLFGRLRQSSGFLAQYFATNPIFGATLAANILSPDLRRAAQAGRSPHYDLIAIDELAKGSVLERVTGVCLRGYTANQLLRDIDAASMSHSLEVRVPYLDPIVTDLALSLPDEAKMAVIPDTWNEGGYRETGLKRILIDIGKDMLLQGFEKLPKRGFRMPFDSWLRGQLRDVMFDTLSEERVNARGLLYAPAVATVRDQFIAGNLQWPQPWLLMMLELWFRVVFDRSVATKIRAN